MSKPKPRWYQKTLQEMGKHDWKKATWANPDWKRNAILPKVTGIICDLFNPEHGYAYPSLDFIASELNLPKQKISQVISDLRNVGAIKKVHRKDVPAAVAPHKGERGLFLELNFFWAYEMAERIQNPRFAKSEEPAHLKAAKGKKPDPSDDAKFTMTVNDEITVTVNDDVHYDSEVDTYEGYKVDTLNGSRAKAGAVYVGESLKEEIPSSPTGESYSSARFGDEANTPLPIPRTAHEAEQMINAMCAGYSVSTHVQTRLHGLLMAGHLTPEKAKALLGGRKSEEAA